MIIVRAYPEDLKNINKTSITFIQYSLWCEDKVGKTKSFTIFGITPKELLPKLKKYLHSLGFTLSTDLTAKVRRISLLNRGVKTKKSTVISMILIQQSNPVKGSSRSFTVYGEDNLKLYDIVQKCVLDLGYVNSACLSGLNYKAIRKSLQRHKNK